MLDYENRMSIDYADVATTEVCLHRRNIKIKIEATKVFKSVFCQVVVDKVDPFMSHIKNFI